ncbi:MAG TPA: antiporter [Gammaproteobacteria bacterium]|nr:antiporter [Gammaproteobacteria bacterium]
MSKYNISDWNVEDARFWDKTGSFIANRNLRISIFSLLFSFAVWLMWGVITVQMLNLHFPFSEAQLFSLTAISGFTGATLRIPSTFMIRIAGGRNTIIFTTALLIIPSLGAGLALQDKTTPLWVFQCLSFLSGVGGGNFASSMSNISFFFPKKIQGSSLGLNAGLGNFGVTTMQILVPLVMTFPLLGELGGKSMTLVSSSGTLIGKIAAGTPTWIQNAGFIWLFFLVPLVLWCWRGLNNITTEAVSPGVNCSLKAYGYVVYLLLIGFLSSGIGIYFILPAPIGFTGTSWFVINILKNKLFILPTIIVLTVVLMRLLAPSSIKDNLVRQYKIFYNKHTWVMAVLYTMTFGSFIGFSASFALSIKIIFGYKHIITSDHIVQNVINPNGPSALMFAWIGPFIGALTRTIGGKIADKAGGAKITNIVSMVMIISVLAAAYFMNSAYKSATPEDYFWPFFVFFIILFTASGIGNGSVFRSAAMLFNREQTGPVLGWISAIAAYGSFYIPQTLGEYIRTGNPEQAFRWFAVFYLFCLIINWWFYLRPNACVKNP